MFKFFRNILNNCNKDSVNETHVKNDEPKQFELINASNVKKLAEEKLPEVKKRREEIILFFLEAINNKIIKCTNEAQQECYIYCINEIMFLGIELYFEEIEKELIKKGYTVEAIKINNALECIVIKW